MDKKSDAASNNVLISIYQEYAEAILCGEKIIEFRKAQFPSSISRVYLYSTSPIKKVVGCFEVEVVLKTSPTYLWNRYGKSGSIGREDFLRYYGDSDEACGILVKSVIRFSRPVDLKDIDSSMTAPQSFCYLNASMVGKLESRAFSTSWFGNLSKFFPVLRQVRKIPNVFKAAGLS